MMRLPLLTFAQSHPMHLLCMLSAWVLGIWMLYLRRHLSFSGVPPKSTWAPPCFKIPLGPGQEISMLYYRPAHPIATLLFSHDHVSQMTDDQDFYATLFRHRLAILTYDYPGYGHSDGPPSQQSAHQAIEKVYQWLISYEQIAPENIFIYGCGLGCGLSVELAKKHSKLGGIILQMATRSITGLSTHLAADSLQSCKHLLAVRRIDLPCLILQSSTTSQWFQHLWTTWLMHGDRRDRYTKVLGDHSDIVEQLIAFIQHVHLPDRSPLYPSKSATGPALAMANNADNRTHIGSSRCWQCIGNHHTIV